MSRNFISARRTARLALAAVVATTGMATTSAVAGAAVPGHHQDDINYTYHVYVAPQGDGSSRVVLIGDTCTLTPDDLAQKPCKMSAVGTLNADGSGVAKATVSTAGHVIKFDETFVPNGPGAGIGFGPVVEVGAGGPTPGTFTAAFTYAPSDAPNVLLGWGQIRVTH